MRHRFDLESQTAVVTGAAGGIGREICLTFLEAGARVAALDSDDERVHVLADELRSNGHACAPYTVDVRSPDQLRRVAERVEAELGPVGVLAANAGIVTQTPALTVSEREWDEVVDVSLKGAFFTCQTFARSMIKCGGVIVLTGSTWSMVGFRDRSPYVAAKTGVIGLMRALALEWAPQVRVNAVCPIVVRTPMVQKLLDDPRYRTSMLERIPLGRVAEVSDVASAVLFLASPAASMITGHALVIDGGWTAQ